jgi:hypothetical protein
MQVCLLHAVEELESIQFVRKSIGMQNLLQPPLARYDSNSESAVLGRRWQEFPFNQAWSNEMRATLMTALVAAGIGLIGTSGTVAAPANGVMIGDAADVGSLGQEVRRCRCYHRYRRSGSRCTCWRRW